MRLAVRALAQWHEGVLQAHAHGEVCTPKYVVVVEPHARRAEVGYVWGGRVGVVDGRVVEAEVCGVHFRQVVGMLVRGMQCAGHTAVIH